MPKPTHRAYIVEENRDNPEKNYWHEVGAVWPHKEGPGFNVVIHRRISVTGTIVCVPPKEREQEEET